MVLANPPFVACNPTGEPAYQEYDFAYHWEKLEDKTFRKTGKLQSRVGKEVLFIERCLKAAGDGDTVCILLPNGVLASSNCEYLRWWITDRFCQVVASIQFCPEMWQVECGLGLVTSILVLRRDESIPTMKVDYQIFMAMVKGIGFNSRRKKVFKRDGSGWIDDDLPQIEIAFGQFIYEEQSNAVDS
jgi:hypothetical protein